MTWNRSAADGGGSSAGTTAAVAVAAGDDTGLARLRELGYKQELKRDLSYVLSPVPLPTVSFLHERSSDHLPGRRRPHSHLLVSFLGSTAATRALHRLSVCL
jgi:hypothetical protein